MLSIRGSFKLLRGDGSENVSVPSRKVTWYFVESSKEGRLSLSESLSPHCSMDIYERQVCSILAAVPAGCLFHSCYPDMAGPASAWDMKNPSGEANRPNKSLICFQKSW
jgi:hypothetical protein